MNRVNKWDLRFKSGAKQQTAKKCYYRRSLRLTCLTHWVDRRQNALHPIHRLLRRAAQNKRSQCQKEGRCQNLLLFKNHVLSREVMMALSKASTIFKTNNRRFSNCSVQRLTIRCRLYSILFSRLETVDPRKGNEMILPTRTSTIVFETILSTTSQRWQTCQR